MRRPAHTLTLVIAAAAIALGVARDARAQSDLARRAIAARFDHDGVPHVDVDAHDLADHDLVRHLQTGLPQTLVTRAYAYRDGGGDPIAIGVRSCRITHDPWRLVYRVQVQTASSDRTVEMDDLADVVRACVDLHDLPVGTARDWRSAHGARVWFAVLVELNPLSPDTVHRIRRWLARPDGAGTQGDAFFGSFVSLFVNRRIGEAERTFRYRSAEEVRCP